MFIRGDQRHQRRENPLRRPRVPIPMDEAEIASGCRAGSRR